MITLKQKKDFLTIRKMEYSFAVGSEVKKVYKFFKLNYLPPTINYTIDPGNCEPLEDMEKNLGLIINEVPEEIKKRFSENIEIQEKILAMIKKRNEQFNYRCGLIKLTTGKGKSHVIIDIANYYQVNTLVLVHNVKTLGEMCEKFKSFTNIEPQIYGGGKKELGPITIMTKRAFCLDYKTIKEQHNFCENFGLVLIDEAPIGFSKKLWESLNIYFSGQNGVALYGLSGTPYKIGLDECDLEKYFGMTIKVSGQKNNGYNIIPKFTMYDFPISMRMEFENPAEMRTAISEHPGRMEAQISLIRKMIDTRKCLLVLTDRVAEAENYFNILKEYENIFLMNGNTKIEDDNKNISDFENKIKIGKKVIIVGTIQKVGVGVDIPYIDTILLASAIKFKATVIQAIGRALRKYKGKTDVQVGVWGDLPILVKQKREKIKSIKEEYLLTNKDIKHEAI